MEPLVILSIITRETYDVSLDHSNVQLYPELEISRKLFVLGAIHCMQAFPWPLFTKWGNSWRSNDRILFIVEPCI